MSDLTDKFKRAVEAQTYELEPGVEVKLRRVGLMDLILQGQIPDTLSAAAADIASRTRPTRMTPDELQRYGKLVDAVVTAALVEPAIGKDISVEEIPFAMRVKIFQWASSSPGVLRLKKFRS